MAKVLRWRVLAGRISSVRETDLILGSESMMKLGALMCDSIKKRLALVCATWVSEVTAAFRPFSLQRMLEELIRSTS